MNKTSLFWFMANIVPSNSGLPMCIWISPKIENCRPRIVVQKDYEYRVSMSTFSIRIEDKRIFGKTGKITEMDVEKVKEFIDINRQLLLDYWESRETDLVVVITNMKKVSCLIE